jgi:2-polyprenyl-6-methoxyphenol hydroxylase-like FAD-dependent oxidoreductase
VEGGFVLERHDVIVVGGGPVGLSLALGLARKGVDVLVLEKDAATAEHSRAPAVWPGTQEILAELGVLDRFEREGISVPRVELWDVDRERVILRMPIEELRDETPYARLLILPQSKTERLLFEAIRDTTSAEVRFSCEVVELLQDASGVEVSYRLEGRKERVRARFVAGCDGADSRVREALGASFEGITYAMQAALADIVPATNEDLRFPRLTTRANLAIGIRMDARLWRLILPFLGTGEQPSLDERIAAAAGVLFPGTSYETVWKSEFRLHRRISSRWTERRIVLAGDAAHLNSPVGGQGMNAGIRDAAELTEALIEALARDDDRPLAEYAARRRRAIERSVNRFTDRLTRFLMAGRGRLLRPALSGANAVLRIGPLRRRFLRRLAMLNPS